MNIAILGATGRFGTDLTVKLLSRPQYQLTLISKSAERIFEDNHRVTAKSMDATNQNALKKALENQDIVISAVSGIDQPVIARNLVELGVKRLIYINVVGIYNELGEGNGDEFNVKNESEQIPNRNAAAIIEESPLDYTILRLGYIVYSNEDDYVMTKKGENAKGYVTNAKSAEKVILDIIENPKLYSRQDISVTRDMS
jgi:Trk K+ transport system NAD-binding subunit